MTKKRKNAQSSFSFGLILGLIFVSIGCGNQNPIIEQQKGEIDYLTRENEELHRRLAERGQDEGNYEEVNSNASTRAADQPSEETTTTTDTPSPSVADPEETPEENASSRTVMADPISEEDIEEKRIEATEDVQPEATPDIIVEKVEIAKPEIDTQIVDLNEVVEEEADTIVESPQAPIYVDETELFENESSSEDASSEDELSEEEAERLAWENRPRQRPQAPIASLSTRQFFDDGTANLTRSAKIYLKLVATILRREHNDDVIEIESQDVDDEPELLSERLNVVLQELEKKMPGILDRVILLDTPLTYSNSKKIEDPHHIKIYPIALNAQ